MKVRKSKTTQESSMSMPGKWHNTSAFYVISVFHQKWEGNILSA